MKEGVDQTQRGAYRLRCICSGDPSRVIDTYLANLILNSVIGGHGVLQELDELVKPLGLRLPVEHGCCFVWF